MRACVRCGKEITEAGRIKYCSKACMEAGNKEAQQMAYEADKERKRQAARRAKKRMSTLAENCIKARELGMSYGQYKAMLYGGGR